MKSANLISELTLEALQKMASEQQHFVMPTVQDPSALYELDSRQFATVLEALKQNKELSSLIINRDNPNIILSEAQLLELFTSLGSMPTLIHLNLSKVNLNSLMSPLADFLNLNPQITALLMEQCGVQTVEFQEFCKQLNSKNRAYFRMLDLSNNAIDGAAIATFLNQIPLLPYSADIFLRQCNLGESENTTQRYQAQRSETRRGILPIIQVLLEKKVPSLSLDLSDNNLTDNVSGELATLISKGVVATLFAHDNQFTDSGIQTLCEAANRYNAPGTQDTVIALRMERNHSCTAKGITLLEQARDLYYQKSNLPVLRYVGENNAADLLQNKVDRRYWPGPAKVSFHHCSGFFQLAWLLTASHMTLTELVFDNCALQSEGLKELLNDLKGLDHGVYPHLKVFTVRNCQIDDAGLNYFLDCRKELFPNLVEFDFSDNPLSFQAKRRMFDIQYPPILMTRFSKLFQSAPAAPAAIASPLRSLQPQATPALTDERTPLFIRTKGK